MPKLKPLADRVVIQRLEAEDKTEGGIILPDTAKQKPQRGKVAFVGSGKMLENGQRKPLDVKKGNVVLFGSYGGTEVKVDGTEYLILSESEILAVVE